MGTLGLSANEFWAMPFREYMCKVHGFMTETQRRRAELRAVTYPIYLTTLAALGGKNKPASPEEFLPIGIKEEPEEKLQDPNGYIKQAFERLNPQFKGKPYANSRIKRSTSR